MSAWIASVPNGSVVAFANGGCYRIDGTVELSGRSNLDLDGNGAVFRAFVPPVDERSMWRVVDSKSIRFHNMAIRGSYRNGGRFTARLQHAHGIEAHGSSLDVSNVTVTDVSGDCFYLGGGYTSALTLSSGTVEHSSCKRTGRNAVSVVSGENILVHDVTTGSIGYDVFDVEPNPGALWGANGVIFDGNTIGSYAQTAYSVVENAPIINQAFTNNRFVSQGMKIAIGDPAHAGYRATNITIANNRSRSAQTPAAINLDNVDGLTLTRNIVPMAGGPMAAIAGSCDLRIAENEYPGGSTDSLIYPWICAFVPAQAPEGATVTIRGSGFNQTRAVIVDGKPASFRLDSGTQITMVVPRGAGKGAITVEAPNGTARSLTKFTVSSLEGAAR